MKGKRKRGVLALLSHTTVLLVSPQNDHQKGKEHTFFPFRFFSHLFSRAFILTIMNFIEAPFPEGVEEFIARLQLREREIESERQGGVKN